MQTLHYKNIAKAPNKGIKMYQQTGNTMTQKSHHAVKDWLQYQSMLPDTTNDQQLKKWPFLNFKEATRKNRYSTLQTPTYHQ